MVSERSDTLGGISLLLTLRHEMRGHKLRQSHYPLGLGLALAKLSMVVVRASKPTSRYDDAFPLQSCRVWLH